jgi:hypothetical protein
MPEKRRGKSDHAPRSFAFPRIFQLKEHAWESLSRPGVVCVVGNGKKAGDEIDDRQSNGRRRWAILGLNQ